MALEVNHSGIAVRKSNPELIFDTEGVTLISRFTNELAAYRARKRWVEVFNRYFLLERGRDYEMSVLSSPESGYFVLNCYFTSACGRYAFWRLINDQAPEAEQKLSDSAKGEKQERSSTSLSGLFHNKSELPAPRVLAPQQGARGSGSRRSDGFVPRVLRYLKIW